VRQRPAVVIELCPLLRGRVRDAFGAGEEAIQVIEAAVLGVDHDDVLDAREAVAGARRAAGGEPRSRQENKLSV